MGRGASRKSGRGRKAEKANDDLQQLLGTPLPLLLPGVNNVCLGDAARDGFDPRTAHAIPLILSVQVKARNCLTSGATGPSNTLAFAQGQNNDHRNNFVFGIRHSAGRWHCQSLRVAPGRPLRPLHSTD
jgi:hypothetical protein